MTSLTDHIILPPDKEKEARSQARKTEILALSEEDAWAQATAGMEGSEDDKLERVLEGLFKRTAGSFWPYRKGEKNYQAEAHYFRVITYTLKGAVGKLWLWSEWLEANYPRK